MLVQGYKKKTKKELLKAIDQCTSISQLCALVQHENIVIQMRCQSGASCIPPKKLKTGYEVKQISPLDKMKNEIKNIVNSR